MKLLLDQNLSPRLVEALDRAYPGSTHVREFGMQTAADQEIWEFARENGYAVLSKDSDFRHMSFLRGRPPEVIWVRLGNCSTDQVRDVLQQRAERIEEFEADDEASFLVLS